MNKLTTAAALLLAIALGAAACSSTEPVVVTPPTTEVVESAEAVPTPEPTLEPTAAVTATPVPEVTPTPEPTPDELLSTWTINESVDPLTGETDIFAETHSTTDSSILGYACFYTNDGQRHNGIGLFVSDDIWFSSNSSTWADIQYKVDDSEIEETSFTRVDHRLLRIGAGFFNHIDDGANEVVIRVLRDPAFDGNEGTTAVFDVSEFSDMREQVYDKC